MIRQAPQDRPADVEKVKRLLIAHKIDFITSQKIGELTNTVVPVGELDDVLIVDPVCLVDFDWDDGKLTLILSHPVNDGWVRALQNMGSFSSLGGYRPERFSFSKERAIIDAPEGHVQDIINYFKGWLPRANTVYKEHVERDARKAVEAQRQKLQQELSAEEARQRVLRNVKI